MKHKSTTWATVAAGVFAVGAITQQTNAQSVDSLLDKLVDKGILSTKEASDLRKDADKNFTKAYQAKSGMPEWVTSLKWNGDFRARGEGFYATDPAFVDRTRFRYRLRFGATATIKDDFEVGLRLTSSEAVSGGGAGGDPISGNTTLQDNGSKKFIYIDMAYAKWAGIKFENFTGSLTFGKMENPFVYSSMLFDHDYTPEGLAGQFVFKLNNQHALKLNGGAFVLDEIGNNSNDPYMLGAQLRLDSAWTPKLQTSLGVGILTILADQNLINGAVPNQNRGNTRLPVTIGATTDFRPAFNFNPIFADASATYSLASFPGYKNAFPIKLFGEYMENPGAPSQNKGYQAGVVFGKAGKKGLWEVGYSYRYLGADAWYEEFPESDFGAFYRTAPAGGSAGYGAGTNVKGHIVKASYSPYDALTLSVSYYRTELINKNEPGTANPPGSKSDMNRLQVDAVWKF